MSAFGAFQPPQAQPLAEFHGAALRMTPGDWRTAAACLRCDPAAIRAVAELEAHGRSGFLPDGRPLLLFEAHQFGELTTPKHRFDHEYPTLSTGSWDRSLYQGGAREYDRLAQAMRLDRQAALMACSWGMFQIMGFNYRIVGYPSVDKFVAAMCRSEGDQLWAFVTFVQKRGGLEAALRRHNWAGFALRYNGSGFRANRYDTRMAQLYRRYAADTTWLLGAPQRPPRDSGQ